MNTETSYKDKITIITFTHLWRDAPSTKLIEKTFDSIYNNINIKGCRHIINYDKKEDSEKSNNYYNNLLKLKNKYNSNIEITTYNTNDNKRSKIYSNLVEMCNTPYIILWEHDFILEKRIDIDSIVNSMDKYNDINFIKFNKRENKTYGNIDKWMESDKEHDIPLIKFCGYTGNPHIERRKWFLRYCKPLINIVFVNKRNSIERAMNKDIMRRRAKFGFDRTHKFLGTYIYGEMNEERYVNSLDEFKSIEAWGSKKPSDKWLKGEYTNECRI